MNYKELEEELIRLKNPEIALHSQRFFKSGKGEYGEGDQFLGLRVPTMRSLVKHARELTLPQIQKLLCSPWHEIRLFSLFVLVDHYQRADLTGKHRIFDFYLANTQWINNWDLVDSSAHKIVGDWLMDKDRSVLVTLSQSPSLWERRIAIMATFSFIRNGDLQDILSLSERLLHDKEDLIHKVVGWMLREAGKRDPAIVRIFLKKHYANLPRTLLRYAIEKYSASERKAWLSGDLEKIV